MTRSFDHAEPANSDRNIDRNPSTALPDVRHEVPALMQHGHAADCLPLETMLERNHDHREALS